MAYSLDISYISSVPDIIKNFILNGDRENVRGSFNKIVLGNSHMKMWKLLPKITTHVDGMLRILEVLGKLVHHLSIMDIW